MGNPVNTVGAKFIRRLDVTPSLRLFIAFTALQAQQHKRWGVITNLARTYAISRTFVSLLATSLAVTCDGGYIFSIHLEMAMLAIIMARLSVFF